MQKNVLKSVVLFTAFLFSSCMKSVNTDLVSDNVETTNDNVENLLLIKNVEFGFDIRTTNSRSSSNNNSEAVAVLISISDEEGNDLLVNEQLSLRTFGENQITEPIKLNVGNYKLTTFHVLDKEGNVIYSTPKSGSNMSSFINKPLDIEFKIEENEENKIVPEVLATSFKTPEDFGYTTFSFEKVNVLQFLISAFIYNEEIANFELTDANIVIKADSNIIYYNDIEVITNHIIFRDNNYKDYEITITKQGYKTVVNNYTSEELKSKFNNPIMVILNNPKELVYEGGDIDYRVVQIYFRNEFSNLNTSNYSSSNRTFLSSEVWKWYPALNLYKTDTYFRLKKLSMLSNINIKIKKATLEITYLDVKFSSYSGKTSLRNMMYKNPRRNINAYLQRVTDQWSEEKGIYDINYTSENQVLLPNPLDFESPTPNPTPFSEIRHFVDITNLIQDLIDNNNNTIKFSMEANDEYICYFFYSFGNSNLNKRAKIKVTL